VTIHYHGGPITPAHLYDQLHGASFCVSHWEPRDVERAHRVGQSVMLDNGAFSAWKSGNPIEDWQPYHAWCDQWLDHPTTWAVIPDVIVGDENDNDRLLKQWPFRDRGAPVWHLHESIARLLWLIDSFPRVCMGSSGQYAEVMSDGWQRRMDQAWREISRNNRRTPNIHMLRGMRLVRERWPFASVDSTDLARNHNRCNGDVVSIRNKWDGRQCPPRFICPGEQLELVA
jgi:hypothetical protein